MRAERGMPQAFLDVSLLRETDECIIWPYAKDNNGYAVMKLKGKREFVSRIVCKKVNGPQPKGNYDAAHSCGKGHLGCINKRHLRWKTRSENASEGNTGRKR